jgi:hypothetical protein
MMNGNIILKNKNLEEDFWGHPFIEIMELEGGNGDIIIANLDENRKRTSLANLTIGKQANIIYDTMYWDDKKNKTPPFESDAFRILRELYEPVGGTPKVVLTTEIDVHVKRIEIYSFNWQDTGKYFCICETNDGEKYLSIFKPYGGDPGGFEHDSDENALEIGDYEVEQTD